jgi:hypothetical protein
MFFIYVGYVLVLYGCQTGQWALRLDPSTVFCITCSQNIGHFPGVSFSRAINKISPYTVVVK